MISHFFWPLIFADSLKVVRHEAAQKMRVYHPNPKSKFQTDGFAFQVIPDFLSNFIYFDCCFETLFFKFEEILNLDNNKRTVTESCISFNCSI